MKLRVAFSQEYKDFVNLKNTKKHCYVQTFFIYFYTSWLWTPNNFGEYSRAVTETSFYFCWLVEHLWESATYPFGCFWSILGGTGEESQIFLFWMQVKFSCPIPLNCSNGVLLSASQLKVWTFECTCVLCNCKCTWIIFCCQSWPFLL